MSTPRAPRWYLLGNACPICGVVHTGCFEHNRDGDPCQAHPVRSTYACANHGGRAIAERSGLGDIDIDDLIDTYSRLGPLLQAARVDTQGRTYIESIQEGLDRANAMVAMLEVLVGTLAPRARSHTEIVGVGVRERTVWHTTEEGMVGPDPEGKLGTHPWVVLLRDWQAAAVTFAKTASDLGLQERAVRVQEVQVKVLANAMLGFAQDLGHDLSDPMVTEALERHLLAIDNEVVELEPGPLTGAGSTG